MQVSFYNRIRAFLSQLWLFRDALKEGKLRDIYKERQLSLLQKPNLNILKKNKLYIHQLCTKLPFRLSFVLWMTDWNVDIVREGRISMNPILITLQTWTFYTTITSHGTYLPQRSIKRECLWLTEQILFYTSIPLSFASDQKIFTRQ